jgi:hypothetical protein
MIKIYQTIVDEGKGNCMQAAFASLLHLPLAQVPHFKDVPPGMTWFGLMWEFLLENNCNFDGTLYNCNHYKIDSNYSPQKQDDFPLIKEMEGIDGYFFASVFSPKFYKPGINTVQHAVLIDKDFNIVHPVNKEYDGMIDFPEHEQLGYHGITNIFMIDKKK